METPTRRYTCALCLCFQPGLVKREDDGAVLGRCYVRSELGTIPETYPICDRFTPRPGVEPPPRVRAAGTPRTYEKVSPPRVVRREVTDDEDRPPTTRPPLPARIDIGGGVEVDTQALKNLMRELLEEETGLGETAIHPRFSGGKVIVKPRDETLQAKEIPIDGFFHKVVMLRDRLRVLEQKVNAHTKLSDADKVELQQYITRCYGSLTTFNFLFDDPEDRFIGSGKGEDG
jgi:hypothetical protein